MQLLSAEFLSRIKVIAFDFDQTLVDEAPSLRVRWQETMQAFAHLSEELEATFLSFFDARGHAYKRHIDDTLSHLGLSDTHRIPILDFFRSTKSSYEKVYPDARNVLVLLKSKGFRVGVMTDGQQEYQEHRLKVAGLYDLFDFFYFGDSHQKPDPAFFRRCIEAENITAEGFLYVGDNTKKDLEGPLALGARACLVGVTSSEVVCDGRQSLCFKSMYDFLIWLQQ